MKFALHHKLAVAVFYQDMRYGGAYWTYLCNELPGRIKAMFKLPGTRLRTFAAGLSMGKVEVPPCRSDCFGYFSCMPTKTITVEIDAYEKLRAAKRGGESFTEVVRRVVIPASAPTGKNLREHYLSGGGNVSDEYLDSAERAASHDPIPEVPWA